MSKVRLALASAALSGLVLLPFAVHLARQRPAVPTPGPAPAIPAPAVDVVELIRQRQFEAAHAALLGSPGGAAAASPQERALDQYRLAVCERALGRADSAYQRLARLADGPPLLEDYRRLWMARGLDALDQGPAAESLYREILDRRPRAAVGDSARIYLAALLERGGDFDQALALLRRQQSVGGAAPEILARIARTQRRRHDEGGERTTWLQLMREFASHGLALEAARRVQPRAAAEWQARARVYYEHGDDRRAIADLRQLLAAYPGHDLAAAAEHDLGRAYARSGEVELARRTFERLYERRRWPSALYRLAGLQVSDERDTDAVDTYARFARLYPRHGLADDALWQAAKAAERHDDFERAGQLYARLAERFPRSEYAEEAAWGVGFTLYCQRQFEGSLEAFRDLSRRARQFHIVDQSLFWAGKSAGQLGRTEEEKALLEQAARGFPRSYYASRAVSLGYGPPPVLRRPGGPQAPGTPAAPDLRRVAGADYLQRGLLLGDLGLTAAAEQELLLAERANKGNEAGLRVVRDSYDRLGLHDRALLLTTNLAGGLEEAGEIERLYPSYYWEEVSRAAQEAQVDPYLVLSVIRQESYFNRNAVSPAGAVGLMQIMPQTGRLLAGSLAGQPFDRSLLFDPAVSIQMGTRFLGDQVRAFATPQSGLAYPLGLAAYNAGPQAARRWLERFPVEDPDAFVERIPYYETRLYVKKVLRNYVIYRTLSGTTSNA